MASEIFPAPPSVSASKKKRSSEQFKSASKKARPSEKALAVVPTLPEPRFAYQGKLFENEDMIVDEGANRYDTQLWDEFLEQNPDVVNDSEDTPVGKDSRGRTLTQSLSGARKDYYKDVLSFDGTPRSRVRAGSNQSVGWKRESSKRESSKKKGTWTMPSSKSEQKESDLDEPIYDADYEDVRNSPQFKKANKDARDLGLPKKSLAKRPSIPKRDEPAAMRTISDRKRSVVNEINDIAKPSTKRKPSLVKSRDLVDEAFDALSDVGKTIGKAGKTVAKAGVAGIGAGFQAIDKGATAFGNSTIGQNIKRQAEADQRHMRSHAKRAAESIKGTGNSQKSGMTAGSLVTQKTKRGIVRTHGKSGIEGTTGSSSSSKEIHGFTCKYVKGAHGDVHKAWFYKGQPVEYSDVQKYLTSEEVNKLRKSAEDIFKGHIDIDSTGSLTGASKGSVPTLTKGRGANGLVNNTKKASASGLVAQKRTRGSHDSDYGYEPAYGNNQTIAGVVTNKTA